MMSVPNVAVMAFSALLLAIPKIIGASAPAAATIEKLTFDTSTHRFSVSWRIPGTEVPVGCEGAFSVLCGAEAPPAQPDDPFPVGALAGDTVFSVRQLRFDTTYRVGMWLRIQGVWYGPEASGFREVAVPRASWEPVRLFGSGANDTIVLFGGSVFLWRDGSYGSSSIVHVDTVRRYEPSGPLSNGFVAAARGFTFKSPASLPPFFIGFRVSDLPQHGAGYGIYRDSSGHALVDYTVNRDTARGIIFVKTSRIGLPFLVLADTVKPRVEFIADTGSDIGSGEAFDAGFTLRDNSSNCRWSLFYGSADKRLLQAAPQAGGVLADTVASVSHQVSATGAGEAGLRMYLVAGDGARSDTINISRPTARTRCNETTTPAGMIMPLASTAALNNPACTDALRSLFARSGGAYATAQFRVYSWESSGWQEYSDAARSAFTLMPGRLFWLITRDAAPLDFGDGRSVSLKDTLSVVLRPRTWTDFSSPYSFPVAFSDILAASGLAAAGINCYRWSKDPVHRTWRADPLYNRSVSGYDDPSTLLSTGTNGYFTVYNPADTAIVLRIPPVPPASVLGKVLPAPGNGCWTVRFDCERDGASIGNVLCASVPEYGNEVTFPASPSFSGLTVQVKGSADCPQSGIVIRPPGTSGSTDYELTVTNTGTGSAEVVLVPHLVAGNVSGIVTAGTCRYAFPQRIPLAIGARQSMSVSFSAGRNNSGPMVVPRGRNGNVFHVVKGGASGSGISVRTGPGVSVKRIELFDFNGRRYGNAAADRSGASACAVIRVTTVDGSGANVCRLGRAVIAR